MVAAFEQARAQGKSVIRLAEGTSVEGPVIARAVRLLSSPGAAGAPADES
jgi:hypothetical protein